MKERKQDNDLRNISYRGKKKSFEIDRQIFIIVITCKKKKKHRYLKVCIKNISQPFFPFFQSQSPTSNPLVRSICTILKHYFHPLNSNVA